MTAPSTLRLPLPDKSAMVAPVRLASPFTWPVNPSLATTPAAPSLVRRELSCSVLKLKPADPTGATNVRF
ncbi:Uncharacterised protein [Bordetella pertussis]|nr:Uncharacterised protein [Bordetella pertussis]CFP64032.1 Uncharacterised protein [Bordetella pertussis]CFW38685.1 Uncharacterised protein [Bordetella pertussis]